MADLPITSDQGAMPVVINDPNTAANVATVTAAGALKVDGSAVTQPVSGTVAATQSGTWTVQPGNTANTTPWLVEQRASSLATYSAAILGLAAAVTPTDIFTIYGSGSKTVKVLQIIVSATENTATVRDIQIIKRSATNTGGTSSSVTAVPHDSNNAGATATVLAYTVNPTVLGASVGVIRAEKVDISATNLVGSTDRLVLDFGDSDAQAIVLRGTNQGLTINLNGVTSASSSFDIAVEWTEE